MSLYNVTSKPDKLVVPADCENYDAIQKLIKNMHESSLKANLKFIDECIVGLQPSKSSSLTYTRTGILFGHSSHQNKMKVERLWERVIEIVGDGPECLITVGALLRWRISLDSNTWLLWTEYTDELDDKTGKRIQISHYWIDNSFKPKKINTAKSLADHFNSRRT